MEINKVIKKILVTEKSTAARETSNKYFFEVDRKANKVEITNAVEKSLGQRSPNHGLLRSCRQA